jgi:hypothetical protein
MKKSENYTDQSLQQDINKENNEPEGYPLYPESEDIYIKFKKNKNLDPEEISKIKVVEVLGKVNEKDYKDDFTGSNMEIQGSALDESEEVVEIEDEENNYLSLRGEDHTDLEARIWDIAEIL